MLLAQFVYAGRITRFVSLLPSVFLENCNSSCVLVRSVFDDNKKNSLSDRVTHSKGRYKQMQTEAPCEENKRGVTDRSSGLLLSRNAKYFRLYPTNPVPEQKRCKPVERERKLWFRLLIRFEGVAVIFDGFAFFNSGPISCFNCRK